MSKYIDTKKLIAEIERRKDKYDPHYTHAGRELEELISFIKSLQQEQTEVDLEKEVKKWKNKHGVVGMNDVWLNFARHFYELGLNARNGE